MGTDCLEEKVPDLGVSDPCEPANFYEAVLGVHSAPTLQAGCCRVGGAGEPRLRPPGRGLPPGLLPLPPSSLFPAPARPPAPASAPPPRVPSQEPSPPKGPSPALRPSRPARTAAPGGSPPTACFPPAQPDPPTMNLFRFLGDLSHLLAIILLLLKIWKSRSCAGETPTGAGVRGRVRGDIP